MAEYYNVTTNLGDAEIANAIATNTKLNITHIAFGDGNGSVPIPNKARTSLVREVHRQAVTKYERHATNTNWIVIETIIPSDIGGFTIREMGIIANGKLISHGSHAPFEKVADPSGVSEYRLRFTQNVTDGSVVEITLDESLIYASQAWVEENFIKRSEIVDDLTTNDSKKPVSAKQAKVLQDNKLGKTENAATATKLATARTINGMAFDGTANITITDNTKLPLAGGTITGSLNVSDTITVTSVGDHANAFKKLIQADTTTDGGYIAVGNHGSDKGYLELGTTDDADAAIYARKRNGVNTVLEEAVILGPDGNTSFPHSVFIHNALGGYGKNGLVKGNGDNAAYAECNIDITSWFGLGIKNSISGERTVVFNSRNGDISTKGSLHADWTVNGKGLGITTTDGLGSGLSLFNGAMHGMPTYGIAFAQTQYHGGCGYVDGDWATYFTMEGVYNRGWIFKSQNYGNVASISSQGLLSIPTMKMDRSNFQVVTGSNYTVTYDYATRIVRIVMKVMSAVGVGHSTSPFKVVEGRWTATFTLPITLQVRLSAEFAFQQVGLPGYKLWDAEAGEWHAWCAPPGHRGSTESAVTVDVVRWRGGESEPVDGYLTVVGFF